MKKTIRIKRKEGKYLSEPQKVNATYKFAVGNKTVVLTNKFITLANESIPSAIKFVILAFELIMHFGKRICHD